MQCANRRSVLRLPLKRDPEMCCNVPIECRVLDTNVTIGWSDTGATQGLACIAIPEVEAKMALKSGFAWRNMHSRLP